MAKLSRLIVRTRKYIEQIRQIDQQPELLTEDMADVKRLALERLLSMIADTVSQIPDTEKKRFPDIPWSDIAGMRNKLVHNYDEINPKIIRDVLDSSHLDDLLAAVDQMNPDVNLPRR